MRYFKHLTLILSLLVGVVGFLHGQCASTCTIDLQDDGIFFNPTPFTDAASGADIDIVAGLSLPTLLGETVDVLPATGCTAGTDGTTDFTFDFILEPFFDVYGGGVLETTTPTGNDTGTSGRWIIHDNIGFKGQNTSNSNSSSETSTGDVSCYNITTYFATAQEAQDVDVSMTSVNTAGETFESASVIFLDAASSPYGTATYNGYWNGDPLGSNGGTNTSVVNTEAMMYTTTGTGVWIAADPVTVNITDPFNPVAATSGPNNNATINASTDAALATTALVGGFIYRVCLEDMAVTAVDDIQTTSFTNFTSTLTEFTICPAAALVCPVLTGATAAPEGCDGDMVTLTAAVDMGVENVDYFLEWYEDGVPIPGAISLGDDGLIGTGDDISVLSYMHTLSNANGGCGFEDHEYHVELYCIGTSLLELGTIDDPTNTLPCVVDIYDVVASSFALDLNSLPVCSELLGFDYGFTAASGGDFGSSWICEAVLQIQTPSSTEGPFCDAFYAGACPGCNSGTTCFGGPTGAGTNTITGSLPYAFAAGVGTGVVATGTYAAEVCDSFDDGDPDGEGCVNYVKLDVQYYLAPGCGLNAIAGAVLVAENTTPGALAAGPLNGGTSDPAGADAGTLSGLRVCTAPVLGTDYTVPSGCTSFAVTDICGTLSVGYSTAPGGPFDHTLADASSLVTPANGEIVYYEIFLDINGDMISDCPACATVTGSFTISGCCPTLLTATAAPEGCDGDMVTLSATVSGGVENVDYFLEWYEDGVPIPGAISLGDDGLIGTVDDISVLTYMHTLSNANGGCGFEDHEYHVELYCIGTSLLELGTIDDPTNTLPCVVDIYDVVASSFALDLNSLPVCSELLGFDYGFTAASGGDFGSSWICEAVLQIQTPSSTEGPFCDAFYAGACPGCNSATSCFGGPTGAGTNTITGSLPYAFAAGVGTGVVATGTYAAEVCDSFDDGDPDGEGCVNYVKLDVQYYLAPGCGLNAIAGAVLVAENTTPGALAAGPLNGGTSDPAGADAGTLSGLRVCTAPVLGTDYTVPSGCTSFAVTDICGTLSVGYSTAPGGPFDHTLADASSLVTPANGEIVYYEIFLDINGDMISDCPACATVTGSFTISGCCPTLLTATAAPEGCDGDMVTLSATVSGGVENVDYFLEWYEDGVPIPGAISLGDDGLIGTVDDISVLTYMHTLSNANGGCGFEDHEYHVELYCIGTSLLELGTIDDPTNTLPCVVDIYDVVASSFVLDLNSLPVCSELLGFDYGFTAASGGDFGSSWICEAVLQIQTPSSTEGPFCDAFYAGACPGCNSGTTCFGGPTGAGTNTITGSLPYAFAAGAGTGVVATGTYAAEVCDSFDDGDPDGEGCVNYVKLDVQYYLAPGCGTNATAGAVLVAENTTPGALATGPLNGGTSDPGGADAGTLSGVRVCGTPLAGTDFILPDFNACLADITGVCVGGTVMYSADMGATYTLPAPPVTFMNGEVVYYQVAVAGCPVACAATGTYTLANCCMLDVTCPLPGPVNLECITQLPPGPVTVADFNILGGIINDSCNPVNITFADADDGAAGCVATPRTVTRTITVTDPITLEFVDCPIDYVFADVTPPSITCPGPPCALIVYISELVPDGAPAECDGETITITAADPCACGAPPIDISDWQLDDNTGGTGFGDPSHIFPPGTTLSAGGSITFNCNYSERIGSIWNNTGDDATLHDAAGNLIDMVSYVGSPGDNVPIPGIVPPVCPPLMVECIGDVPAPDITLPVTSDNCLGAVTVTHEGDVSDGLTCPETITRTYRATDACGNFAECVQIIVVDDMTAPVVTCPPTLNLEGCSTAEIGAPPYANVAQGVPGFPGNPGCEAAICAADPFCCSTLWDGICAAAAATEPACIGSLNIPTPPFSTVSAPVSEADFLALGGTINEACGVQSITYSDVEAGSCPITVTRTYVITDLCGNATPCDQTITIDDTTAPVVVCPPTENVEGCSTADITSLPFSTASASTDEATFLALGGAITEACGVASVTYSDVAVGACPIVVTRTFVVTDLCGNVTPCDQTINVDDMTAPVVTCPPTLNLEGCSTAEIGAPPYANVAQGVPGFPGNPGCEAAICAADPFCCSTLWDGICAAAAATEPACIGSLNIPTPPFSTVSAPVAEADFLALGGMITEACGVQSITYSDVEVGACPITVTRTYVITDLCGNATPCDQTITIDDTTAPVLVCPPTEDVEGCSTADITSLPFSTASASTDEATFLALGGAITEACGVASVTYSDVAVGACPIVVTRTFVVTDLCGNVTPCDQTINVDDMTAPVVTCPPTLNLEGCSTAEIGAPPYANVAQGVPGFPGNPGCEAAICAADPFCCSTLWDGICAAAAATEPACIGSLNIPTPPFSTVSAPVAEADFLALGGTINEACGVQSITYSDVEAGSCPITVTRTYVITDLCGNATPCDQTITIDDTTAPVVVCPPTENVEGCSTADITSLPFSTASASTDEATFLALGGAITEACGVASVTYSDVAVGACPIVVTRTFVVTDLCGNVTPCNQTINVDDNTAPVLVCPPTENVEGCSTADITSLPFSTASASIDEATFLALGGAITEACGVASVTYSDVEAGMCPIVVTRTFVVTDDCGNATPCDQIINVDDTTPPVITCPSDLVIEGCSVADIAMPDGTPPYSEIELPIDEATFLNLAGTIVENCNVASITYIDTQMGSCPILVNRVYTVTDDCGNIDACNQTITIDDTTAPDATCPPTLDIEGCDTDAIAAFAAPFSTTTATSTEADFIAEGGILTDNCGIASVEYIDVAVGVCPIVVTRSYTFTDDCGNTSICDQTITVDDTTPPTLTPAMDLVVECDGAGNAAELAAWLASNGGATAMDDCGFVWTNDFTVLSDDCGATGSATVTFTATDPCGNESSTTATFTIVDTEAPAIVCPPGAVLTCNENPPPGATNAAEFLALGGAITESCTPINDLVVVAQLSDNGGTNCPGDPLVITRTYTVIDDCGNAGTCEQVFTYLESTQGPVITSVLPTCYKYCGSLANPMESDITYETDCNFGAVVTIAGPEVIGQENCPGTIYRFTYTVTDDCGRVSAPVARDFVIGNEGPEITCAPFNLILECGDPNNQSYIDTHLGQVMATSSCELGVNITYSPQNFDLNTCGSSTVVTFTATDDCGRQAVCTTTVAVQDNVAPEITSTYIDGICNEAICGSNVSFWFNNWMDKVEEGLSATDNCDNLVTFTTIPSNPSANQDCPDNIAETVVTWVANDNCGNTSTISYIFYVVPAGDPEPPASANIGGLIATEIDEAVEDVAVTLTGGGGFFEQFITGNDGMYTFTEVPLFQNYQVSPYLDQFPLNGVSTFDLVLINKHILEIQLLDSPYKMIAADINKSGSITTLDLLELRKLILFIETDFPNNTSWRFVDAGFIFPNPENPFASTFPELASINNLTENETHDFVGVKIGDVNNSSIPNSLLGGEDRSFNGELNFEIDDQLMEAGTVYEIPFRSSDFNGITGYQYTLNFDNSQLEFINVEAGDLPGLTAANFGLTKIDEGVVTTSWNSKEGVSMRGDSELFTLTFIAKSKVQLSEVLSMSSQYTIAEAYNSELDLKEVQFRFETEVNLPAEVILHQNTPNPFMRETVIGFELPKAEFVTLGIYNLSGHLLKEIKGEFEQGYNQVEVSDSELGASGVLYYRLITKGFEGTMKMIVLE